MIDMRILGQRFWIGRPTGWALLLSVSLLCLHDSKADNQPDPYRLKHYPPKLDLEGSHPESLEEMASPDTKLRAFMYCSHEHQAMVGVVDAHNKILWQLYTGAKAGFGFFWSADGRHLAFWTDYWYSGVDLYAKHGPNEDRDENYVYVLEAKTGKIVYEMDPDLVILHLDRIADPRKMRPTLLGGGSIEKIEIVGNKLTIAERFAPESGPMPWQDPLGHPVEIPDWIRHPLQGSMVIPGLDSSHSR